MILLVRIVLLPVSDTIRTGDDDRPYTSLQIVREVSPLGFEAKLKAVGVCRHRNLGFVEGAQGNRRRRVAIGADVRLSGRHRGNAERGDFATADQDIEHRVAGRTDGLPGTAEDVAVR